MAYNAGHVLGAAMFMLEIAGVKILYTGDFSRVEDRHLMAAEIPSISPDALITESTHGTHVHEQREVREARFTTTVHEIVTRGGRCLIPVFALGRAQELLLILNVEQFDDIGPCVIMASPGMMQSGLSRQLFEAWCTDKRNGVTVAGYCVEGTLAKHILLEPSEVVTMTGQKLPLRMSADYISYSAHMDYDQTSDFIRSLRPPHIDLRMEIYNPRNTQAVELYFRGERMAKVMGKLAGAPPEDGLRVLGVLIKRGFNYHLIEPSDLSNYTELSTSSVTQHQLLVFSAPFSLFLHYLQQLSSDAELIRVHGKQAIRVTKYTLRLCTVKDGCLELTFQMPRFVKEVIFPLTDNQKAALKAEGLIHLTCGDYQCPLEEAALPEVPESLGTSLSAMAGLPNPERREIRENGKLKLLPKVFIVYAHNPGEYLQIRPPNVDEVMRKDPSMTRELIQQRYEQEEIRLSEQTEENIREHKLLVWEFSDFLCRSGVAVAYDQLLADTGTDNLMRWTERQIEDSDYVILIVTPLREFLSDPSYASRDEEYIFSGHTLYNLIHNPPSRPNSPLGLGVLCFLPVFLESTKNLSLLPKTLEAGSCYEIWKPFDVQRRRGDDLVSLYTLLTRQSVCPPPEPIAYVPIRRKKRFGDGVIDPGAMTQEQQDVHRQLSACSQQLSDRAFRELAYKAEFAAEWGRLAPRLGLGEAEIERIGAGGGGDEEACLKMLRQWKETQGEATVAGLVEAILKIRNFPLLQLLYRVYAL